MNDEERTRLANDDECEMLRRLVKKGQAEIAALRLDATGRKCNLCPSVGKRYDLCPDCAARFLPPAPHDWQEELAQARAHVAALTRELETAIAWFDEFGTPSAKYAPTPRELLPQLRAAYGAARAWLGREEAK